MSNVVLQWAGLQAPDPIPTLPGWTLGTLRRFRDDPIGMFAAGAALGHPVLRLRAGPIRAFAIYDPEAIHQLLVAPSEVTWKGTRGARLLRRVLGEGLLTAEGAVWKDRRRRAQPHFRRESLAALPGIVTRHTNALIESWKATSGPVDAAHAMNGLALAVVCDSLFGGELDPADAARVSRALEDVLDGFLWMTTFPIEGVDRWPLPSARRHRAAVAALGAVVDGVVARRRASGDLGKDLLGDWLVAADRGELTADDVRSEAVTLLLAGHETTANVMAWTIGLLGQHPEERARVRAGLAAGDTGPLDRAIQESMRLYPPAWIVARATKAPLDLGPATLPAGSFAFAPISAVQRDPKVFADPDAFAPNRWLAPDAAMKKAWMPFGAGQRKCIGEHFARMGARVALAGLYGALDLPGVAGKPLRAKASVTLRPADGVWVTPAG
jgi:cytochrome P450